ncbi:alpha-glucuronidase family glycosyl hydrolase [Metabacillus malikii]|uniref:Xylan alpha-1,2-glucuronidase n=1 Tax=Metabacillus malikii TaxID=1504265 RepID=A0ABT9ZCP9_9BACI|nr:alpha-glucuronidase family glycosyl hydrolase [Metabacillus malikii]MDQ0229353.1 alpha-glucuronidase [Metabacillus malikii]
MNNLNYLTGATEVSYHCWLQYTKIEDEALVEHYQRYCQSLLVLGKSTIIESAVSELQKGLHSYLGSKPSIATQEINSAAIILGTADKVNNPIVNNELIDKLNDDGYIIKSVNENDRNILYLVGKSDIGVLYAAFHLLRLMASRKMVDNLSIIENPRNQFRMINQWDNMDGSIERGYSGQSIFYTDNQFSGDWERIKDYARLLSSVGINAISINNVNVFKVETNLITEQFLPDVAKTADIFRAYGIKTFLSINYASPIEVGKLETADPLNPEVEKWWQQKTKEIYSYIPDFGGFVVKADSEHRPGPFSYNRNHADGANVLAKALQPFGGVVIWRCFVYNCLQDWRDRSIDRAKAAYDNFKPLDGKFLDNVILQIKNGPMDFQVREPVSPLFGAMSETNQLIEFQVAQEYTGQQIDLCYLVPQWKEVLDFDTYAKGKQSEVKNIVDGSLFNFKYSGIAAVSNIGNDTNWTGNTLAQANLYGYGRLIWNPELSAEEIAEEWVEATFGHKQHVKEIILNMLMQSWPIYENYTAPLGVGWMINPGHHYGPNIDGYEYSVWGTYHFADHDGIGVDRTIATGTGYTGQYFRENADYYESLETCPDELLLFFHHVPYTYRLHSGKTVIQHIYDTHFEGVEQVKQLREMFTRLEKDLDKAIYANVLDRLERQLANAKEWRDKINTYFYRKSGINDEKNRMIY